MNGVKRVTFFGHGDCSEKIKPRLRAAVEKLCEEGAELFLVGNQGNFDRLVLSVLREVKEQYPIRYAVVLAYLPHENTASLYDPAETIYPEELEKVPRRFAISARNRWMIERSDAVVTYVVRPQGGAAKFAAMAERKGKRIIPLSAADIL